MRKGHFISIAVAIALIGILYWGANTKPPAKPAGSGMAATSHEGGGPHEGGAPHTVEPASFDSILTASRKELPAHAKAEIEVIEKNISAAKDSQAMSPMIRELAVAWQQHKVLPVAGFYYATSAKLDNSEKNLNFAGQLFLDMMHDTKSASVQAWEAQQAISCFQRSLELNPKNDTVKMALAASYIEGTGEPMQGIQLLLGIIREKPDNMPAGLMLGRLAIQSGQFDKAIQRYEGLLKLEPENTEALYFLAEAYKGKGDKQKAIELFEKCKKIINKPEFTRDIDHYINSFK